MLMRLFGVDMWFDLVHVGMISTTGVVVAVVAFLHKCERWRPGAARGATQRFPGGDLALSWCPTLLLCYCVLSYVKCYTYHGVL